MTYPECCYPHHYHSPPTTSLSQLTPQATTAVRQTDTSVGSDVALEGASQFPLVTSSWHRAIESTSNSAIALPFTSNGEMQKFLVLKSPEVELPKGPSSRAWMWQSQGKWLAVTLRVSTPWIEIAPACRGESSLIFSYIFKDIS